MDNALLQSSPILWLIKRKKTRKTALHNQQKKIDFVGFDRTNDDGSCKRMQESMMSALPFFFEYQTSND